VSRLRVAVVGCGHLGSIHARLLKSLDHVQLVAVVDPVAEARQRVAQQCECAAWEHHAQLAQEIDAAVVATPTQYHHDVALDLLERHVHVLVEKPLTSNIAQADALIEAAGRNNLVLQVGHVERFNPAWNAVAPALTNPQYIEAVRAGGYTFRSTDVSIVLDLMIHDLDLILSLARSPVVEVDAMGLAMFGPHEDLAMARLKFANGCVASLRASRVDYQPQRTMRVYAQQAFASIDFAQGQAQLVKPRRDVLAKHVDLTQCLAQDQKHIQDTFFQDLLCLESVEVDRINAILEEQAEFVASIESGSRVRVTGEAGRDALAVAERILRSIAAHRWNGVDEPGPHARFCELAPQRRAA